MRHALPSSRLQWPRLALAGGRLAAAGRVDGRTRFALPQRWAWAMMGDSTVVCVRNGIEGLWAQPVCGAPFAANRSEWGRRQGCGTT